MTARLLLGMLGARGRGGMVAANAAPRRCGLALAAGVALCLAAHAAAAQPAGKLPPVMQPAIVQSIDRGLAFLVKIQQPDGSFPANWEAKGYPAAMTGLAGLALLASGSTPEEGPYAPAIKKAMLFLLELGEKHRDGLIAGPQEWRSTYGQGFAMQFLALCYGMEAGSEFEVRLRALLEKGIALFGRGQSPKGGWLYSPVGGGDEASTTAVVIQALRACRNAGLKAPPDVIQRAVGYLRFLQNNDGGIAYSSAHRGASRPPLAAQALACFYAAGVYDRGAGGDEAEAAMVEKLWRYLKMATPNPAAVEEFFFYQNFYLAQAMYVRGGREWDQYYKAIAAALLKKQAQNGTWNGDDVGPVYGTALATCILQLPYGHLPLCER